MTSGTASTCRWSTGSRCSIRSASATPTRSTPCVRAVALSLTSQHRLALVFAIVACGSLNVSGSMPEAQSRAQNYLALAQQCLSGSRFISHPTIASVQTLLVMCQFFYALGRVESVWPTSVRRCGLEPADSAGPRATSRSGDRPASRSGVVVHRPTRVRPAPRAMAGVPASRLHHSPDARSTVRHLDPASGRASADRRGSALGSAG